MHNIGLVMNDLRQNGIADEYVQKHQELITSGRLPNQRTMSTTNIVTK